MKFYLCTSLIDKKEKDYFAAIDIMKTKVEDIFGTSEDNEYKYRMWLPKSTKEVKEVAKANFADLMNSDVLVLERDFYNCNMCMIMFSAARECKMEILIL